nr:hypothetical protein CFP56_38982 [Quercus suber]
MCRTPSLPFCLTVGLRPGVGRVEVKQQRASTANRGRHEARLPGTWRWHMPSRPSGAPYSKYIERRQKDE